MPSFLLNMILYASIVTPMPPGFTGDGHNTYTFVSKLVVTAAGIICDGADAIKIGVTADAKELHP